MFRDGILEKLLIGIGDSPPVVWTRTIGFCQLTGLEWRHDARWWSVSLLVDSTIVIDWREMLDGEKTWMIRGMPARSFISRHIHGDFETLWIIVRQLSRSRCFGCWYLVFFLFSVSKMCFIYAIVISRVSWREDIEIFMLLA